MCFLCILCVSSVILWVELEHINNGYTEILIMCWASNCRALLEMFLGLYKFKEASRLGKLPFMCYLTLHDWSIGHSWLYKELLLIHWLSVIWGATHWLYVPCKNKLIASHSGILGSIHFGALTIRGGFCQTKTNATYFIYICKEVCSIASCLGEITKAPNL